MNAPTPAPAPARPMIAAVQSAPEAASPLHDGNDLEGQRAKLLDLCAGQPVVITTVDLVATCNLLYEPLDPEVPPGDVSCAAYALDCYWFRVAEQESCGGLRARGMHYTLCRYVLPWLLEHRSDPRPLQAARWTTSDFVPLIQILAGQRALPAATVAGDTLGRLGVTCHWLTLDDAAIASGTTREAVVEAVSAGLPTSLTRDGEPVVRAIDLREAGMLAERSTPHGLARDTADLVLGLAKLVWSHALNLGVPLVGSPDRMKTKNPKPAHRQRTPRPTARVYVPIERCMEVAAQLHPVHQLGLWAERLVAARQGEVYGCLVEDRRDDLLHLAAVGGAPRDVRDEDGSFNRADRRVGTKGTSEGVAPDTAEAARGIRHRFVPLVPPLVALWDAFDVAFHLNPETGEVETWARAIPGLQAEDRSGAAALDSALRRACAETADTTAGPVSFSAHDLRASLNTDLENAGVKGRLLRHLLGHRSEDGHALDVHDAHYDLGLDAAAHATIAAAIQGLLPDGIDLRIPTGRLPQFGKGTRHAARMAEIEDRLLVMGWYVPDVAVAGTPGTAPTAPTGSDGVRTDDLEAAPQGDAVAATVTVKVAAQRLGMAASQVKRLLSQGLLRGRKTNRGRRQVWLVEVASLEAELDRRAGLRVPEVADALGVTYNRVWQIVHRLGLTGGRATGDAIRLGEDDVARVRAELDRQAAEAVAEVTHAEAAANLCLPEPLVQTLVRAGELTAATSRGRIARVTRASVEEYQRRNPPIAPVAAGETVVPVADVRDVLGLSRHAVSNLVRSRRLAVIAINRRQYIGSNSIRTYLASHPTPGADARLALLEVAQP